MEYKKAAMQHVEEISELVRHTILSVYPKYYPKEVVEFFCQLYSKENIAEDIKNGNVGMLMEHGRLIGTGSYEENHISRVYIDPAFQQQGYGSYIMQLLESEIALTYDKVLLDASLPANRIHERRGYKTLYHEEYEVENGAVLVYAVMQKQLSAATTSICYNGKFFVPKENTPNGEVGSQTLFSYQQNGAILSADYAGGDILKGQLLGTVSEHGELDFYYQHMNKQKKIRIGRCHSVPRILENGKIELFEEWQWLNGDQSKGSSTITEI